MSEQPSNPRVAIITGAGSGIGRATALELAGRGWSVTLAGRQADSLNETAGLVAGAHPDAATLVVATDVADATQAERLVNETMRRFARIDALVNNAGLAPVLPIEKTDPGALRRVFDVNALGPGYLIHYAWPIMLRQRSGRIVNVSTLGTADPFPGFFAYAAAKSALNAFAMSCAKEGKRHNIRAFSVAPGAVETAMLRANFSESVLPREACASPEDVAQVLADCATGRRDADNGRTIYLTPDADNGA